MNGIDLILMSIRISLIQVHCSLNYFKIRYVQFTSQCLVFNNIEGNYIKCTLHLTRLVTIADVHRRPTIKICTVACIYLKNVNDLYK
jgi:hypothetical protein